MGKTKLNKKGFTLIELLAVIVILAILILLAMPSVLNIMENARKNAFITEAQSFVKAANTKYAQNVLDKTEDDLCYDITDLPVDKDFNGYSGSIKVAIDKDTGKATYTIWLSNGDYSIENKKSTELKAEELGTAETVSNACDNSSGGGA